MDATTATGNGTHDQLTFEMALQEGDRVEVIFQLEHRLAERSFRFYRALGTIVRVNDKSFRIIVTGKVGESGGEYLIGRTLAFPRCFDYRKWSVNNGVFPVAS